MAATFYIPGRDGNAGFTIGVGDTNRDGKLDFDFGVRAYNGYGNGYSGAYNSSEIGFNTARGTYVAGESGSYTPWSQQSQNYRADSWGTQGSQTYSDVAGNYTNNRYARDVFGGYYEGNTTANSWSYQNQDRSGNVYGGPEFRSGQYADVFGRGGSYNNVVPQWGQQQFCCCGGRQVQGWFGGGCF